MYELNMLHRMLQLGYQSQQQRPNRVGSSMELPQHVRDWAWGRPAEI
jgi:hypothetical protein